MHCWGKRLALWAHGGTGIRHAEQVLAGQREGANDQHADHPDHHGNHDGDYFRNGGLTDQDAARRGVVYDGNGDTPPGESGIEAGGQQPGAEKIPTSLGSSRPRWGVKRRAMPAKSMPQKAMAKTVDQRRPAVDRSPSISARAKAVVE